MAAGAYDEAFSAVAAPEVNMRRQPWTDVQNDALWEQRAAYPPSGRTANALRLQLLKLAAKKISDGIMTEPAALAPIGASAAELASFRESVAASAATRAARAAESQVPQARRRQPRGARAAAGASPADLPLTPDQAAALEAVLAGASILLTGPAGTGKSFTVARIVVDARARFPARGAVAVTATTGTAAQLIDGRTLNSWLGAGLARGPAASWSRSKAADERMRAARLLIVDEASMLAAEFLEEVNAHAQRARGNDAPFGGLQIVFVGDFAQLPPVGEKGRPAGFAFAAAAWAALAPRICLLTTIVRQADPAFQQMLQRLRVGRPIADDIARLEACRATEFPHGIEPTRLRALNRDADDINRDALDRMLQSGAELVTFERFAFGGAALSADAPTEFSACVGAQVMVTRNCRGRDVDGGSVTLANGTRAVLIAAAPAADPSEGLCATLQLVDGSVCVLEPARAGSTDGAPGRPRRGELFMPLQLAWAISIHRAQGATLDALEIDLGPSLFECGQAYVAVSRARDLASVRVTRLDPRAFRCNPAVLAFYG